MTSPSDPAEKWDWADTLVTVAMVFFAFFMTAIAAALFVYVVALAWRLGAGT